MTRPPISTSSLFECDCGRVENSSGPLPPPHDVPFCLVPTRIDIDDRVFVDGAARRGSDVKHLADRPSREGGVVEETQARCVELDAPAEGRRIERW